MCVFERCVMDFPTLKGPWIFIKHYLVSLLLDKLGLSRPFYLDNNSLSFLTWVKFMFSFHLFLFWVGLLPMLRRNMGDRSIVCVCLCVWGNMWRPEVDIGCLPSLLSYVLRCYLYSPGACWIGRSREPWGSCSLQLQHWVCCGDQTQAAACAASVVLIEPCPPILFQRWSLVFFRLRKFPLTLALWRVFNYFIDLMQ